VTTRRRPGLDRKLISLTEAYEIRDWCKALGCDEKRLRAAVAAVGHSAQRVREWLAAICITQPQLEALLEARPRC
jgi:hypothetical protein